ncbi:MAG TPA: FtsW/RodA/SpoVE family cell cycle protein, partial [Patescibacteria group bacterium]|nr:FtsW/RodA/SpoVE family cell cycle protein [Patescibacteria group bacterium]
MTKDVYLSGAVVFLLILSIIMLRSVAPGLFPLYFVYIFIGLIIFWFFAQIDFDVISLFSTHLYVLSILLLVATLVIGSVTRGTIRWIPVGPLTLQSAELVRPLLLVFFANFLTSGKLDLTQFVKTILLLTLPAFLILVQPSLGVSVLTIVGFFGVLIASDFNKKHILFGIVILAVLAPLAFSLLAPYQKQRLLTFASPDSDPLGAGYNSLQSVIAAGSGKIFGKGLGRGVQTQLSF